MAMVLVVAVEGWMGLSLWEPHDPAPPSPPSVWESKLPPPEASPPLVCCCSSGGRTSPVNVWFIKCVLVTRHIRCTVRYIKTHYMNSKHTSRLSNI